MFLSDKQGTEFKKIFNTNIKCNCQFICTCNLTDNSDKIYEGFKNYNNNDAIKIYGFINQIKNPYSTLKNTIYNNLINTTQVKSNEYYEKAKEYNDSSKPAYNIQNIKPYLNKNVQVTDLGNPTYKYKKCISNNSLNTYFDKQYMIRNPTKKQCSTQAANYNRKGFVIKDKVCYITKPNVNNDNIPLNSSEVSNYPIISKSYYKNSNVKATLFNNGDFGLGYMRNNKLNPSYSWYNRSTINKRTNGCNLDGSLINVKDATYRNNAIW